MQCVSSVILAKEAMDHTAAMSKQDIKSIVEELARDRVIEKLASKYASPAKEAWLADLCQDLYIELLKKSPKLVIDLYVNNELEWYIRKMLKNQLFSKTSKWFYMYKQRGKTKSLEDIEVDEQE